MNKTFFLTIMLIVLSISNMSYANNPVVLISGTVSDESNVKPLADYLTRQGRQVYTVALADKGFARTIHSVIKIKKFIQEVRRTTGYQEVDVVAYSQGAHVIRRYLQQNENRTNFVDTLVMLGSPTYQWSWMTFLHAVSGGSCLGIGNCIDQHESSQLMKKMNEGPDMPQGVTVFNIWTEFDYIVTPAGEVSRLKDGNTGTQFSIQDVCPARWTGHIGLVWDYASHYIVERTLRGYQPQFNPSCLSLPIPL
jgi:triacylglycerol lipase